MQEFKKNKNVVKLEPKPMKVEGKLLDLKNKGAGFRVKPGMTGRGGEEKKTKRFHSPKGTMEPTDKKGNKHKIPLNPPFPKGEGETSNSISWQVEEGKEDTRLSFAGKLILFVLVLTAGIGYILESPIMVLTFILFTIVFYMLMKRGKSNVDIQIDLHGVKVGGTLYSYDNLKSFWVFYDPPYEKYLSIGTKSSFSPYVRIKLDTQNPVEVRNFLIEYLPEEQHPSPFMEVMMERLGL